LRAESDLGCRNATAGSNRRGMFTGIIQTVGRIGRVADNGGSRRLCVELGELAVAAQTGDSFSLNGVCLTVAENTADGVCFDVIPETLQRTSLGTLKVGDRVNAERSLRAGDRLGGHFVLGHVDGTARVERIDRAGGEHRMWLGAEAEVMRYMVPKGSVALDGVSLTVADLRPERFSVALIPTTLRDTTLGQCHVGDTLNVETDLLVRSVARLLEDGRSYKNTSGITMDLLREHGFAEALGAPGSAP